MTVRVFYSDGRVRAEGWWYTISEPDEFTVPHGPFPTKGAARLAPIFGVTRALEIEIDSTPPRADDAEDRASSRYGDDCGSSTSPEYQ